MINERITLEELASTLATSVTWNPTWFNLYESMWSVARKISIATVVAHEHVIKLLADNNDFSTASWLRRYPRSTLYLPRLLQLSQAEVETMFVDRYLRNSNSNVISLGFRYCKQCMNHGYHSCLHQLYFFNECPVHKSPLLTVCPHCASPTNASLVVVDSFTHCYRCRQPYFPPRKDWMHEFESKEFRQPLIECAQKLSFRSMSESMESLWRPFDSVQRRIGVDERPSFEALGTLWTRADFTRRNDVAMSTATVPTDCYYRMGLRWRRIEEMTIDSVRRLANTYGCELSGIRGGPRHHRRWSNDIALLLVITKLKVPAGLILDRVGTLNSDLLLGAIAGDSGRAIDSPEVIQHLIDMLVQSLFLDAYGWLVSQKPKCSHWDDWLEAGRQLISPVVWIALPARDVPMNFDQDRQMLICHGVRKPPEQVTKMLNKVSDRAQRL